MSVYVVILMLSNSVSHLYVTSAAYELSERYRSENGKIFTVSPISVRVLCVKKRDLISTLIPHGISTGLLAYLSCLLMAHNLHYSPQLLLREQHNSGPDLPEILHCCYVFQM